MSEENVDAPPHPWNVAYEYCAIFERQFSLLNAGAENGRGGILPGCGTSLAQRSARLAEPDGSGDSLLL